MYTFLFSVLFLCSSGLSYAASSSSSLSVQPSQEYVLPNPNLLVTVYAADVNDKSFSRTYTAHSLLTAVRLPFEIASLDKLIGAEIEGGTIYHASCIVVDEHGTQCVFDDIDPHLFSLLCIVNALEQECIKALSLPFDEESAQYIQQLSTRFDAGIGTVSKEWQNCLFDRSIGLKVLELAVCKNAFQLQQFIRDIFNDFFKRIPMNVLEAHTKGAQYLIGLIDSICNKHIIRIENDIKQYILYPVMLKNAQNELDWLQGERSALYFLIYSLLPDSTSAQMKKAFQEYKFFVRTFTAYFTKFDRNYHRYISTPV